MHPAGADDEVRSLRENERREVGVVGRARFGVRCVARLVGEEVVVRGGNAGVGGAGEAECAFPVGKDVNYPAWESGVEERLEVRAAAGDEDEDSLGGGGCGVFG